jgi:hypothetical protein
MQNDSVYKYDDIVNRARLIGMKHLQSNKDAEVIYALIEKEGIPENIARQVSKEIVLARYGNASANHKKEQTFLAKYKLVGGLLIFTISIILIPGGASFPVGLILGGGFTLLFYLNK